MRVISIFLLLLLAVSAAPWSKRSDVERASGVPGAPSQLSATPCYDAIDALFNLTSNDICGPGIELFGGIPSNIPKEQRIAYALNVTTDYCTTDHCDQDLQEMLAFALDICSFGFREEELREIKFSTMAMCSKIPSSSYCLIDWSLFVLETKMMEESKGKWTYDQLKGICTPCVDEIARFASGFLTAPDVAPFLKAYVVCDNAAGNYSVLDFQYFPTIPENPFADAYFPAETLDRMCTAEMQRAYGIRTEVGILASRWDGFLPFTYMPLLCSKNSNGYCMHENEGLEDDLACNFTATCSASCKAFVVNTTKSVGCCANSFKWGFVPGPKTVPTIFHWCGLPVPPSCFTTNIIRAELFGVHPENFDDIHSVLELEKFANALAYRAGTFPIKVNGTFMNSSVTNDTLLLDVIVGPLYQSVLFIEEDLKSPFPLAGYNAKSLWLGWKDLSQPPTVIGTVVPGPNITSDEPKPSSGVMSTPLFSLVLILLCCLFT